MEAVLTVNNVHSPGTMVNHLACSKALPSTKIEHGESGAIS